MVLYYSPKIFSNSFGGSQILQEKHFQANQLIRIGNNTLVVNGWVNQLMSSIGYSVDSYVDHIIISLDFNGNTVWSSIFDYNKTYESSGDMAIYNGILYSSLFTNDYPWFLSVNSSNGKYIQSNTFTSFNRSITDSKSNILF